MIKRITAVIFALVLLFSLSGCQNLVDVLEDTSTQVDKTTTKSSKLASNDPISGGSMSIAVYGIDTLDPILTKSESLQNAQKLIYDGLLAINQDRSISCNLAENYEISENGKTITFVLKQGVVFHDGHAFTAKDVDYTVNHIMSKDSPYTSFFSQVKSSYREGSYTYVFRLNNPDYNFLYHMDFPILEDGSAENATAIIPGTGPYAISKEVPQGDITLKSNANWHGGKKPYINEVILKYLPTRDTVTFALDAKEVNAVGSFAVDYLSYSPKANVNTKKMVSQNLCFLGINNQNPYLKNQLARWAIEASIDKDQLKKNVLLNKCTVTNLPLSPEAFYVDKTLNKSRYDVSRAKNIIDMNILKEGSKSATFSILVCSSSAEKVKVAESICDMLKTGGIMATVVSVDYDTYKNRIGSKNYDLFVGETELSNDGDVSNLLASGNWFAYQNTKMDDAIYQVKISHTAEDLKKSYANLSELMIKECAFVPLYFKQSALLYDSRLKGEKDPSAFCYYRGMQNWYISD